MHVRLFVVVCACLVGGCQATTTLTTIRTLPARDPHCDFEIFTASPVHGFIEVGTIDFKYTGADRSDVLSDFKHRIEPYVCKAGGDAAIAVKDGYGFYYQATVLKAVEAPPAIAAGGESSGGAQDPGPGCRYDTQCKGDRICVNGGCVDPEKK